MTATLMESTRTTARIALTIGGKVYGPYSFAQIEAYAAEGRVTPSSLISRDGGSWIAAGQDELCAGLFAGTEAGAQTEPRPAPAPVATAMPTTPAPRTSGVKLSPREAFLKEVEGISRIRTAAFAEQNPGERRQGPPDRRVSDESIVAKAEAQEKADVEYANFILIFDVKSRHHGKLEESIMELGAATRVLPGIWAVHAKHTSGSIRNQLIEHFGKLDSLFIIDATRDKLAWFNLGPEADAQIRKVWKRSN